MENNPKVSVILPIYNAYDYLRPAIESILDQTLREIEIICIDNGSTDHSCELIREYAEADARIRFATEESVGPSHARNNGMCLAKGEYIAFLDADDFFEPTMLQKLYDTAKEKGLDIAIAEHDLYHSREARFERSTPAQRADALGDGRVTSQNEIPDSIYQTTDGFLWNKLFRRAFLEEKGLTFPIEAEIFEDLYFVCAAIALAARIGKVEEVLVHRRMYSNQLRVRIFRRSYDTIVTVFGLLRSFLMHHGLYLPLSASYVNLVAKTCHTVLISLPSDKREEFWNLLHDCNTAEQIGLSDGFHESITDPEIQGFVIEVQLYSYRQVQRHPMSVRRLSPARILRLLKSVKTRERIRSLFKRKNRTEKE